MAQAHTNHTATLLPDGKVLVAGGRDVGGPLVSAEVYDPATGGWTPTTELPANRSNHTATLLPGGMVLIAGGVDINSSIASAKVYVPTLGTWAATGSMAQARASHTATLLPSGKVLIAGGQGSNIPRASAEVYDPDAGTWAPTGVLAQARHRHTATLLMSGKVLVAGGQGPNGALLSAEVYDPATETWTATGSLAQARSSHTATLLPGGKVLVTGGRDASGALTSAEVYDPGTGTWASAGSLTHARYSHTATLLPNGRVLLTGGSGPGDALASVEVYNPASRTWTSTGSLAQARYSHAATLLPSGEVLVSGGFGNSSTLTSAEVYDPTTSTWAPTGSLAEARRSHTATLLPGGEVLVSGGAGTLGPATSAEVYNPHTKTWATTRSPAEARYDHTATLLPSGKVLLSGGQGTSFFPTAELHDSTGASDTWRPVLGSITPGTRLETGYTLTLSGSRFRGLSEGSSGSSRSSPTDYPMLTLVDLEGRPLRSLLSNDFSSTSATATTPALPSGHYLLLITVNGLSDGQVVFLDFALEALLESAPATLSNQASASFHFSAGPAAARFECSLDEAAFAPCTSPAGYTGLAEGSHSFQVRAVDAQGQASPLPARYTWSVDVTVPDTTLDSTPPAQTTSASASFRFSTNEAGAGFECSLDGAAYAACSSPLDYTRLADGTHSFLVRSRDEAGNRDATPASHTWTQDATAPDTTLDSAPPAQTHSASASFSFSTNEAGASFQCSLDGAAYTACTSPVEYAGLADGGHLFRVRAMDALGNLDATPASHIWDIDSDGSRDEGGCGCTTGPASSSLPVAGLALLAALVSRRRSSEARAGPRA
jgi:uncharacterized protein (TIGR03382 family)